MSHPDVLTTETRPPSMVDCNYVIYGKIIVDDIVVKGTPGDWGLGTGHPQGLDWGQELGVGPFLV
jgi:hypothetical protein